jgi:hypothetical protein
MSEHFQAFIDGMVRGDVPAILAECRDDFVYDDPIYGRMNKTEFADHLTKIFAGEWSPEIVSNVVTRREGQDELVWCWLVEGALEGAVLTKVAADGVRWQKVAYYAHEPNLTPGRCSI